jgi:hypothetical protein
MMVTNSGPARFERAISSRTMVRQLPDRYIDLLETAKIYPSGNAEQSEQVTAVNKSWLNIL